MVLTDRPSPALHVWSFTRCVCCSFLYPLFLHWLVLHSPLACLFFHGRGALSVACSVSSFIFSFSAMSVPLTTIVVIFYISILASTSAHDAVVAGQLSACTLLLRGHTVFK